MKYKILFCLINLLGFCFLGSAQTQQGYVKTNGRLVNGQYVKGERVPDVTIQIKGRSAVRSKPNGSFSFPIPNKQYSIQQVQKHGYVLLDPDILSLQYAYSVNPIVVLMADKSELDAYRRSIEHSVRNKLYSDFEVRKQELEELKKQNKVTEEKYHELLQQINNDYDDNEKIVKEMADLYSKMDFDSVDDFNRHVSDNIINGRLEEALFLIRSKGDLGNRTEELNRLKAANAASRKTLARSETMEAKMRDDIAQDYYNMFNIFRMMHMNDSAAYYIEERTELDTTNIEWNIDAGLFLQEYTGAYDKSLSYFFRASRHTNANKHLCNILNRIGTVFFHKSNLDSALYYYKEALQKETDSALIQTVEFASTYDNIAVIYDWKGNFVEALEYHRKAITTLCDIKDDDTSLIATMYNNLAVSFEELNHLDSAFYYYRKALTMRERYLGIEHQETAVSYNNVGYMFSMMEKHDSALVYYKKAAEIQEKILTKDHPSLANTYNNIGACERSRREYANAIKYHNKALMIQEKVLGKGHFRTATTYNNIGAVYEDIKKYDDALKYYLMALKTLESLLGHDNRNTAIVYNNVASLYGKINDCENAVKYGLESIGILKKIAGEEHIATARAFNRLGRIYYDCKDYSNAIECFQKALPVYTVTYGEDHELTLSVKKLIKSSSAEEK